MIKKTDENVFFIFLQKEDERGERTPSPITYHQPPITHHQPPNTPMNRRTMMTGIVSALLGILTACGQKKAMPEGALKSIEYTVSGTMAGDHVAVIVNHLPSRFSGSFYREEGGRQIKIVKDSLQRDDPDVKIFIMGDMNDDPQDPSMAVKLGARREISEVEPFGLWNPFWNVLASGTGTLQYDGKWNLFDQIILSRNLIDVDKLKDRKKFDFKPSEVDCSTLTYFRHQVFRRDYLFQQEGKYKGNTLRTHAGGQWLDGYSDHLPTVVSLVKEQK